MPKRPKIKNVILLGKKPGASYALEYLLKKGIKVPLVVAAKNEPYPITLRATAKKYNIPIHDNSDKLYQMIERDDPRIGDIDLVISYLFWDKIKQPLINLAHNGCINFHPAPLPDYKSRAGYNTAILDQRNDFGVSAHFIDSEEFDAGPIIKVLKFPIDSSKETAFSLEKTAQEKMSVLFKEVVDMLLKGEPIKTTPNKGGLYLTSEQLEAMKNIDIRNNSAAEINRKIRAFFFPPYKGAKLAIQGEEFTLINDDVLAYIHKLINNAPN